MVQNTDSNESRWTVGETDAGIRLDLWVATRLSVSRSVIQREVREGSLLVNKKPVRPSYTLRLGDTVDRTPPPPPPGDALIPESIALDIVYEDDAIVVINKAPGLVVYPAAGHRSGTLLNGLKMRFPVLASVVGAPLRPGVVHRLDKDTSGLMVVALSDAAYYALRDQFQERSIRRRYAALVTGSFREEEGTIETIIGRSERDRKKMSTRVRKGKPAVTHWQTRERYRDASFVEFRLATGRTHQIRVHCASLGHPVLGDRTYGGRAAIGNVRFPRQMLHAETLEFVHPTTGRVVALHAPIPEDMRRALEALRTRG